MQSTKVSYSFTVNDTQSFLTLLALCVLEFLVLVVLFISWLTILWGGASFSLLLGFVLIIALPIITFYFFRKKATREVTVSLAATEIKIQWPSRIMVISFADIESYSACRTSQESFERESIRIRLKNKKKLRLTATSDLCDINPIKDFREAFDTLAQNVGLQQKNTWEERMLMKNKE